MAHFNFVGEIKKLRVDFFTRKAGDGKGRYKFLRGAGQNAAHPHVLFLQQTDEFKRLVG